MKKTTITVQWDLKNKLNLLKYKNDAKDIDEIIRMLLQSYNLRGEKK